MNGQSHIQHTTQPSHRPVDQSLLLPRSPADAISASENRRTFLEDFNMEHTVCGSAVNGFTADPRLMELAEAIHHKGLHQNLPSCVYLG